MALLSATTLVLGIPFVVVTLPLVPVPHTMRRRVNPLLASRTLQYLAAVTLSLLSAAFSRAISDVLMLLAFLGTFTVPGKSYLPTLMHCPSLFLSSERPCHADINTSLPSHKTAFIHIVIHNFRRPLSIVMPMPPNTPSVSLRPSDSHTDELLQQKERMLQRRRLTRRLFWDIGVWVLLLPVGGGGVVWAAGRLAGHW